jgi:hypothetical protein
MLMVPDKSSFDSPLNYFSRDLHLAGWYEKWLGRHFCYRMIIPTIWKFLSCVCLVVSSLTDV